jgi:hypothetical protein
MIIANNQQEYRFLCKIQLSRLRFAHESAKRSLLFAIFPDRLLCPGLKVVIPGKAGAEESGDGLY